MAHLLVATSAVLIVLVAAATLYGSRRNAKIKSVIGYVARSVLANIIPLGYVTAMLFFLYLFDTDFLAPFAPYSHSHKRFIRFVYSWPIVSLLALYLSDPGRVTSNNFQTEIRRFEFDDILYTANTECRTCLRAKPARSKHCSACGHCVVLQDHHCVWVNNCIGRNNFWLFAVFLVVNAFFFTYGILLLAWPLFISFKETLQSNEPGFFLWRLFKLGRPQRTGALLLMLCVQLLPLVLLFSFFSLRQGWLGATSNEADKWQDIQRLVPKGLLYTYPNTNILLFKHKDGRFNRKLNKLEQSLVGDAEPKVVRTVGELPNIYDKGFSNNMMVFLGLKAN